MSVQCAFISIAWGNDAYLSFVCLSFAVIRQAIIVGRDRQATEVRFVDPRATPDQAQKERRTIDCVQSTLWSDRCLPAPSIRGAWRVRGIAKACWWRMAASRLHGVCVRSHEIGSMWEREKKREVPLTALSQVSEVLLFIKVKRSKAGSCKSSSISYEWQRAEGENDEQRTNSLGKISSAEQCSKRIRSMGWRAYFCFFIVLELRTRRAHILSFSLSSLLTRDEKKTFQWLCPMIASFYCCSRSECMTLRTRERERKETTAGIELAFLK